MEVVVDLEEALREPGVAAEDRLERSSLSSAAESS
jgi:hypothetical protein